MNPPCKGCKERQLGCHSTCERYAVYRQYNEKLYEERRNTRTVRDFITDSYRKQSAHVMKNKKWKKGEQ